MDKEAITDTKYTIEDGRRWPIMWRLFYAAVQGLATVYDIKHGRDISVEVVVCAAQIDIAGAMAWVIHECGIGMDPCDLTDACSVVAREYVQKEYELAPKPGWWEDYYVK